MRRFISFFLTLAFFIPVVGLFPKASNALEMDKKADIVSFEADTYSVICGETKSVTFTAKIDTSRKLTSQDVAVYSESGEFITYLLDNGKSGDIKADDGIYSAKVNLSSNRLNSIKYHAEVDGKRSFEHSIKYRNIITDTDFNNADILWKQIESYEKELSSRGIDAQAIAHSVYDMLMRNYSDSISSINWNSDKSFSFMLNSGIENYFEHFSVKEETEELNRRLGEELKSLSYIGKGSVAVWCPYYGLDNEFTMSYMERAEAMSEASDFENIDSYYASAASVSSFKNFDKYGIVMIDSHGADHNGGGYICIPRPGEYDRQDVADGHLVLSGSTMLLGGSFIQKYCDTLPNSIVYTGICYGLSANNFYAPLLNHGAGFIAGFDNSVTFTFDGVIMNDFCQRLVEKNPVTNSQYTAGEAYDACVDLNGYIDKYSDDPAKFIYYGNDDVVASAVAIPVESISLSPEALTLYYNNTYKLKLDIFPENANRHTEKWSSDAPSIVSVDEKGQLYVKNTDGKATITCTVTDTAESSPEIHTAKMTVTVDGSMPVSGISIIQHSITLFADTETSESIKAEVMPLNASNQKLLYEANDEGIATVDSNGNVIPKGIGRTYITVTTEDGGYSENVVVNVVAGDINRAVNKSNGVLEFITDTEKYPAETVSKDGRYCAATTNIGKMNSNSYVMLNAGHLTAGTKIVFDWAVSSEAFYDEFRFMVNNDKVFSISGTHRWETMTYTITENGNYTFRWLYVKDYATNTDEDRGWLDEVDILIPDELHTVTFTDFDGNTIDVQKILHGESAKAPEVPKHEGTTFIGWSTDFTNVRDDINVEALYDISEDTCIVVFIGMQGQHIATLTVKRGEPVTPPQAPEEEGYVFLHWSCDLSCIMQNTEVHAQYGILGDANADGKFNTGDATYILRYKAGLLQPTDEQLILADFNKSGEVNTGDATAILKWLVSHID